MSLTSFSQQLSDLETKGFAVIPGFALLSKADFPDWTADLNNLSALYQGTEGPHYIFKSSAFQPSLLRAKDLVMRSQVPEFYCQLYNLDSVEDLSMSYDGYVSSPGGTTSSWAHFDHGKYDPRYVSYQGQLVMTATHKRVDAGGLFVWPGSHLVHGAIIDRFEEWKAQQRKRINELYVDAKYADKKVKELKKYPASLDLTPNWLKLHPDFVRDVVEREFKCPGFSLAQLDLKPGDFIVWNSKLLHQATYPSEGNPRRVAAFITFAPRAFQTEQDCKRRIQAMLKLLATSHHPATASPRSQGDVNINKRPSQRLWKRPDKDNRLIFDIAEAHSAKDWLPRLRHILPTLSRQLLIALDALVVDNGKEINLLQLAVDLLGERHAAHHRGFVTRLDQALVNKYAKLLTASSKKRRFGKQTGSVLAPPAVKRIKLHESVDEESDEKDDVDIVN
jgi:hypothetical protein